MVFNNESPIYQQIAERIKNEILNGSLQELDKVKSTNEYASFYQVNPATVAKAFHLLIDEEVLYKKRGVGMFVKKGAFNVLLKKRRQQFFEEYVEPMILEAKRIGISLDEIQDFIEDEKGGERK